MLFNKNNILETYNFISIMVIEKIGLENVKIFFSNAPPHSNLRRSLEINGLKCKLLL